MTIEIERKFLIKFLPNERINYSHNIKQGYIVSDKDKVIRIRKKNDKYFLPLKVIQLVCPVKNLNIQSLRMMEKNY